MIPSPLGRGTGEGRRREMPKVIEGSLSAKGLKFGIIASRFNVFITNRLLEGALDVLSRSGAKNRTILKL